MRKLPSASVIMILAISLYFTLSWGFEGVRMLTSSTYGLDDVWRSQFVFAIGSYFHLTPVGLIKLAAFFATLKLAVAVICAVHIVDRFSGLISGSADTAILEAGLILVVAVSIVSVGPAVWSQNAELLREGVIQLSLAALAAALCMLERTYPRQAEAAEMQAAPEIEKTAFDATMARSTPRVHA
jgi:hypothetical protein